MPAIWGDNKAMVHSNLYRFDAGTIGQLNRDWMGYWETGTGANNTEWPYMKVAWDRWFIDKVGAAEGYAGHGIYDVNNVSHMSISYWGIGKDNDHLLPHHDLSINNA